MTGSFSDDPDKRSDEIDEKIARLRALKGWTGDTVHGSAPSGEAAKPAAKLAPLVLRWTEGGKSREVVVDQEHFEIGSGDRAQLRLLDTSISARHCRISAEDGAYKVRDLRSLSGTFVNGEKVPLSLPVKPGDELTIGDITFTVGEKGAAAPVKPAAPPAPARPAPAPAPARAATAPAAAADDMWDSKTVLHDVPEPAPRPAAPPARPTAPVAPARPAPAPAAAADDMWDSKTVLHDPDAQPRPAPPARPAAPATPPAGGSDVWDPAPTIMQSVPPPSSALRHAPPARPPAPSPLPRPPVRPATPAPAPAPAAAPAVPTKISEATLRWSDADGNEREIAVKPTAPVLVGRRPECGIRLNDGSVSSRHCVFEIEDGALIVRDLGSTNGTFFDKVRISRQVLKEGDEVFCGLTGLRVSLGGPAATRTEASGQFQAMAPVASAFHLVHMNDTGAMASVVVGGQNREVPLGGSRFTWSDGTLRAAGRGMVVNGKEVDEARLERGHVRTRNGMRVLVVREAPRRARPPADVANVARWIKCLGVESSELEVLLVDPTATGGRIELCMWGDGVVEVDVVRDGGKTTQRGQVAPPLVRAILMSLAAAGFPDALGFDEVDAAAPEIHVRLGNDSAKVTVGPKLVAAIGAYGMARELLFGVACEVGEVDDQIADG